jgi:hypothetical protein
VFAAIGDTEDEVRELAGEPTMIQGGVDGTYEMGAVAPEPVVEVRGEPTIEPVVEVKGGL